MKTRQAYLVGAHRRSFRQGEAALIIGVKLIQPPNLIERPCYEILFDDGTFDFIPISDVNNGSYIIISKPKKN